MWGKTRVAEREEAGREGERDALKGLLHCLVPDCYSTVVLRIKRAPPAGAQLFSATYRYKQSHRSLAHSPAGSGTGRCHRCYNISADRGPPFHTHSHLRGTVKQTVTNYKWNTCGLIKLFCLLWIYISLKSRKSICWIIFAWHQHNYLLLM